MAGLTALVASLVLGTLGALAAHVSFTTAVVAGIRVSMREELGGWEDSLPLGWSTGRAVTGLVRGVVA